VAETRIGIVGARFAGSFHADCWATVPGARIVAVADSDEEARERFRATFRVPRAYAEYRQLITDPEVRLVDICLPNFLHAEVAIAAMEAGRDVVCEKPLATSLPDADRVVATRSRTGRRLFYAEDWIFAPALVRAKAIVAERGIGRALYWRGRECHSGSHSPFAQKVATCGGGSVIHLAVHPIGFFNHLLGLPAWVTGACSGGGPANLLQRHVEGEDWGLGILEYPDGTRAVVEGNYITVGGMDDSVEVYGSDGVLKIEMTFGSPISAYSRKGFDYAIEKADFTHGWTRPAVDEYANLGYKDELRHVAACLAGEAEQMHGTTAEDGRAVLRIIDAIYRSSREGRRIELDSTLSG
jgi:predicted dehydrogenase